MLETERLLLRRPTAEDHDGYAAFMMSERSCHAGGVLDAGEAWRAYATHLGHWELCGFGMLAVTEKGSDACIGLVGAYFPYPRPEKEIGWILWPEAEGRGIGMEAAGVVRDWVYRDLGWVTAVSYIHPDNARSIRLAERLGAQLDTEADEPKPGTLVYRHPAPEDTA